MLKVGMFTSGYQRNPLEHCFMDAKEYGYDYIELFVYVGDFFHICFRRSEKGKIKDDSYNDQGYRIFSKII